jgi:hypothetical protein
MVSRVQHLYDPVFGRECVLTHDCSRHRSWGDDYDQSQSRLMTVYSRHLRGSGLKQIGSSTDSYHRPYPRVSSFVKASHDNMLAEQAMYSFFGLIAGLLVNDYDLQSFDFWCHNSGHQNAVFCCCIVNTLSLVSSERSSRSFFAIDSRFHTLLLALTLNHVLGQTRSMEP